MGRYEEYEELMKSDAPLHKKAAVLLRSGAGNFTFVMAASTVYIPHATASYAKRRAEGESHEKAAKAFEEKFIDHADEAWDWGYDHAGLVYSALRRIFIGQ